MSNKAHQHHYVPQSYMRLFSVADGKLYALNKKFKTVRETSSKGVAYSHDFYTVDTVDEENSSEVEEAFAKTESRCIPIIKQLAGGRPTFSNAEYADLAIYIALQYGRTPTARAKMDKVSKIVATAELKNKLLQVSTDQEQYDDLLRDFKEKRPDVELPSMEKIGELVKADIVLEEFAWDNGGFVQSVFRMAEEIAQGLLSSRWIVLDAPNKSQFVTTDNPVIMRMTRPLRFFESPAILLPGTEKYLPLSNRSCLAITDGEWGGITHAKLTKNQVRAINRLSYLQASKYVISGNEVLLKSLTSIS
jgi:hypothetical protein